MKNRYNKFVFRTREEIWEVSYVLSKLPTVSAGEYAEVLSVYTDNNGNRAVVPSGWTVSGVSKENTIWGKDLGLVSYCIPKEKVCSIDWTNPDKIETLQKTYDQFVWTPVSLLKANGTLDGVSFIKKFGRRNYRTDHRSYIFDKKYCHENLTGELALEKESVDKYGGYYSTRYIISKDKETGKPRSIKGEKPWTEIDLPTAKKVVSTGFGIKGHLMYGAEYDTREEWIIETKTKTYNEIVNDSTEWGNYINNGSRMSIKMAGSCEEWRANNIYDFAGNVSEWTQEIKYNSYHIIRGGSFLDKGDVCPAHYRVCCGFSHKSYDTGFRATIYIR